MITLREECGDAVGSVVTVFVLVHSEVRRVVHARAMTCFYVLACDIVHVLVWRCVYVCYGKGVQEKDQVSEL